MEARLRKSDLSGQLLPPPPSVVVLHVQKRLIEFTGNPSQKICELDAFLICHFTI